jgi:hypothetical protein
MKKGPMFFNASAGAKASVFAGSFRRRCAMARQVDATRWRDKEAQRCGDAKCKKQNRLLNVESLFQCVLAPEPYSRDYNGL